MTTKQIAESVNRPEKTVRTWASKASAKMAAMTAKMAKATSTHPADWDLDEACLIIEIGLGKNAAALYRESAKKTEAPQVVAGSSLTARDLEMVATLVTAIMTKMESRVANIETKVEARQALLPSPTIEPRARVNMIVRDYVEKTGNQHSAAWGELYKQFSYRTHSNPKVSAKNRGMTILDYIEAEGQIETLEAVAFDIFGGAA